MGEQCEQVDGACEQVEDLHKKVDEPCEQALNLPSDETKALSESSLIDFSGRHDVLDGVVLIASLCFDHVTEENPSIL